MKEIQIIAPAKINLTLDITGKRPDGYHSLVTVMHQISLADTVVLARQERGITLSSGHIDLANDNSNLAWRAAQWMLEHYVPHEGVSIQITKRIPIGAGLAGGSTDAAAVIRGMNTLFQLHLSLAELCDCGSQLGADVPFCIAGGTALCTGKGEVMRPLVSGPHLHAAVVKPDFSLSTAAIYQEFDRLLPTQHPDHAAFLAAWESQNLSVLPGTLGNILEPVSLSLHPEIGQVIRRMRELGAYAAQMTGSGPAVFGLFSDAKVAQTAVQVLKQDYKDCFAAESYASS